MPPATTATTAGPSTISTTMATTTAAPPSTTMPDGPSGSGCTPGDTVALPEGEWYGVVVSASPSGIEFDLACWFTGEPAVEAAAEDGAEPPRTTTTCGTTTPRFGRSRSPRRPKSSGTRPVTRHRKSIVTFADWVDGVTSRGLLFGVWLDVIDGEVLRIREQWVP